MIHIPGSIEDPCVRCRAVPTFSEKSWREPALAYLERRRYDGHVFVPEFEAWREWDDNDKLAYAAQVHWEWDALEAADVIVFWVPRSALLPGLTTNVEFGYWVQRDATKIVLGYPPEADHMRYLHMLADEHQVPVFDTLAAVLDHAMVKIEKVIH